MNSGCSYRFRHPAKPKDQCGLPVPEGVRGSFALCVWHAGEILATNSDLRTDLVAEVAKEDHWLEGACLSAQELRDLNLFRAKLPYADLEQADLSGAALAEACLDDANLRSSNLESTVLSSAILKGARLDQANVRRANLENADLTGCSLAGTQMDGAYLSHIRLDTNTVSFDTQWGFPGEFRDFQFQLAAQVFRQLSAHYRSTSYHAESQRFYFLEMTALHLEAINARRIPEGPLFQRVKCWLPGTKGFRILIMWIAWTLHRFLWGYGVHPFRTIAWMVAIVLFFGLVVFPITGVRGPETEVQYDLLRGLALSVVTFATLGYGNRVPDGTVGELLGGIEALSGVLLTSMFLVALAGRYVHRG